MLHFRFESALQALAEQNIKALIADNQMRQRDERVEVINQIPDVATAVADLSITRDGAEVELLQALKSKIAESTRGH